MQKIIQRKNEKYVSKPIFWLESVFSFSFADYYNNEKMGFRSLKVINDDVIKPQNGFDTHFHKNYEIFTLVTQGAITHEDTEGNRDCVKSDEVQLMSAGAGISHSEMNLEATETKLFQIWIKPNAFNTKPSYQKMRYRLEKNHLALLISNIEKHKENTLKIRQNAYLSIGEFNAKKKLTYSLYDRANGVYLLVERGKIKVAEEILNARDEIGMEGMTHFEIEFLAPSKILLFEVN